MTPGPLRNRREAHQQMEASYDEPSDDWLESDGAEEFTQRVGNRLRPSGIGMTRPVESA